MQRTGHSGDLERWFVCEMFRLSIHQHAALCVQSHPRPGFAKKEEARRKTSFGVMFQNNDQRHRSECAATSPEKTRSVTIRTTRRTTAVLLLCICRSSFLSTKFVRCQENQTGKNATQRNESVGEGKENTQEKTRETDKNPDGRDEQCSSHEIQATCRRVRQTSWCRSSWPSRAVLMVNEQRVISK